MLKTIPAIRVHTYVVGTVDEYRARREASAARPPRKKNLRDLVGAAQSPSIGEVFGKAA